MSPDIVADALRSAVHPMKTSEYVLTCPADSTKDNSPTCSPAETNLNGNALDISELNAGVYILWLEHEGVRIPLRVVKQ